MLGCSVEKKARKAFNLGKYETAIDLYAKSLAANPRDGRASYFIAESYRLSNRVKESEPFYQKAGGPGIDKDTVKFYYAQALKSNGKYEEARQHFNDLMANATEQKMKERARVELEGMDYINKVASSENFYKVKNLELVNSPNAEYAPVYLNGELYITAARATGKVY
ncbi:MAG: tetratricopeptide repeat protein [Bacteroidia bacterium]|nr:tetratricopeptide repeat protein [Bacteroidia bacterium]